MPQPFKGQDAVLAMTTSSTNTGMTGVHEAHRSIMGRTTPKEPGEKPQAASDQGLAKLKQDHQAQRSLKAHLPMLRLWLNNRLSKRLLRLMVQLSASQFSQQHTIASQQFASVKDMQIPMTVRQRSSGLVKVHDILPLKPMSGGNAIYFGGCTQQRSFWCCSASPLTCTPAQLPQGAHC